MERTLTPMDTNYIEKLDEKSRVCRINTNDCTASSACDAAVSKIICEVAGSFRKYLWNEVRGI